MKKYWIIAVATVLLVSCGEKKFHIEGNITQAEDSVLFFESIGLAGTEVLDSTKLDAEGNFSFAGRQPEAPEFYQLRIADQTIALSIDSTETVQVKAQFPQMATGYEVTGSENCEKMKELALMLMDLQQRIIAVSRSEELNNEAVNDSVMSMINNYKQDVKTRYIFPNPSKPYAYFALFQTIGNRLLFNPRTDKDDIKVYGAVATSWDTFWPTAERGANLHNIAIEGMKNIRIAEAEQSQAIDASKIQTTGLIDIALQDNKGKTRRLSNLKGKVVLLDFHVFAQDESPVRILMLRELYNKFHAQGLEIYQVSLDSDEHFWKQQTAALPWINVREERGLSSSKLTLYNVQSIPEYFLIDRGNNIVGRSQTIKDIEQAIKNLL